MIEITTGKQALEWTKTQWFYYKEAGGKKKDWPGWKDFGKIKDQCFLRHFFLVSNDCLKCPYHKKFGFCNTQGFPFNKWLVADTKEERMEYASDFYDQLCELEVEEERPEPKFKVGDRVKVGKDDTTYDEVAKVTWGEDDRFMGEHRHYHFHLNRRGIWNEDDLELAPTKEPEEWVDVTEECTDVRIMDSMRHRGFKCLSMRIGNYGHSVLFGDKPYVSGNYKLEFTNDEAYVQSFKVWRKK